MLHRALKSLKALGGTEIIDYLSVPLHSKLHYEIGGISELLDITMGTDINATARRYVETLPAIPADAFTLHWVFDLVTEGNLTGMVGTETSPYMVSYRKVGSRLGLVTGWKGNNLSVAMLPVFVLIPIGKQFTDSDEMLANVDNQNFIAGILADSDMYQSNEAYYFLVRGGRKGEGQSIMRDMRSQCLDVFYRFLMVLPQSRPLLVHPNMKIKFNEGFLKLPSLPNDYTVLVSPNGGYLLGYTRTMPEVHL